MIARQAATLTATASAGWSFYDFNNGPFWLPGGLGANPKTFYVPDTGNPVNTTVRFSNTPVYSVNVQPNGSSSNLYVFVDSQFAYAPKNFSRPYDPSWTTGSTHSLSVDASEFPYSVNGRYDFLSWSDGGARSHNISSLPAGATQYTATLRPAFRPATNFSFPPCGGSAVLGPASPTGDGFFPGGQSLNFSATPAAGWSFAGWSYDLSGTATPKNLVANDETLVYANFNTTGTPLRLTSLAPSTAAAGGAAFTLTLTGTGFTPSSLVSVKNQFKTVTFVNATTLRVQVSAADIATSSALQVFVENFPAGWNGCAVFGYQTFLVTGPVPRVATPVFSPIAGTYTGSQVVSISDATVGATIRYTTNGANPTATSPIYTGPITVSATTTLKAIALKSGQMNSLIATAKYTIKVATPAFSPPAGTYAGAQTVSIADATAGATIRYTANGTTPTASSTLYTGPIAVDSTKTLKAIAIKAGLTNSAVATASYTIRTRVATPVFSPPAGTYTGTQMVTITVGTAGATIHYTTNGSAPTAASPTYTSPITVSSTRTIRAIAVKTGLTSSVTARAVYTIQ